MRRQSPAVRRWQLACASIALAAMVILSVVLGCSPDDEIAAPASTGFGVVAGQVFSDSPGGLEVQLSSVGPEGSSEREFRCLTDLQGRYRFEPPAGGYLVGVRRPRAGGGRDLYYTAGGLTTSKSDAETLWVEAGLHPRYADFHTATLVTVLEAPAHLDPSETDVAVWNLDLGASWHAAFAESLVWSMLPPGTYALTFEERHVRPLWAEWAFDPQQAGSFQVSPDGVTKRWFRPIPPPSYVRGLLTGESGWDDNTRASVVDQEGRVIGEVPIALDGSFDLKCYLEEEVRVRLCVEEYSPCLWYGGYEFERAVPIRVVPGGAPTQIEIVAGSIEVAVEPPSSDLPFSVSLRLEDQEGASRARESWYPDLPGVRFRGLLPGVYYLHIDAGMRGPVLPLWYPAAETRQEATPIVVDEQGNLTQVSMSLLLNGSIAGTVVFDEGDGNDEDVDLFRLLLTSSASAAVLEERAFLRVSPSFSFVFWQPDGDYRVGLAPADFDSTGALPPKTIWWRDQADWEGADIISVRDHAQVTGIELHWPSRR